MTAQPGPGPMLTPTATATPVTLCGGPPVMTILAIGSDTRGSTYTYGLSDVMRAVRVDFVNGKVMVLAFPRDLYVEIPGISEHGGITHGKLNQAYLYGNPGFGYYDGPGEGPGLLALTLEHNFGLHTDHYIAVNMQTFVRIVDAVGGIDIDLPYTVDGRDVGQDYRTDLVFRAGHHHLNGQQALMLARLRPNGVFARTEVQSLILYALRDRLTSPDILPKLPELIATFLGSVQTDLSAEQIAQLTCLATHIRQPDLIFVYFPAELFKGTRIHDPVLGYTFVWDVDFNLLRAYVGYFNAGTWPASPTSP
ncbi:MAG: hypothetical protein D6770_02955 [Anaerolineae bacterium]|nr:MAG: hypothetical protein D6770_02955 [Anaerolineae bacterium]